MSRPQRVNTWHGRTMNPSRGRHGAGAPPIGNDTSEREEDALTGSWNLRLAIRDMALSHADKHRISFERALHELVSGVGR